METELTMCGKNLDQRFPAERNISRRAKRKETLTVEEYGLMQRYHWIYSVCFRDGNMIVQQSVVMLWSSITGTRPGVILPQSEAPPGMQKQTFESDIPKHVCVKDGMPKTVCWEDIELFYLPDPDGGRDVLCAVIEFRNLKGRPEGADG
jgi:hypothetical protein